MTNAEYLVDKLTCPVCGGRVQMVLTENHGGWIGCCATITYDDDHSAEGLMLEWLILTGGPIPGEVPMFGGTTSSKPWYLISKHRTEEVIRPWLGRPYPTCEHEWIHVENKAVPPPGADYCSKCGWLGREHE